MNRSNYYNSTSLKTSRMLHIALIVLFLVAFRVWQLSIVQKDERVSQARKPQRRSILEKAERGTIWDRYGTPLALNRIKYNAAVYYAHLKQIPSFAWKKAENGRNIKIFPRKEYIARLSEILAQELGMEREKIEDLIHSKASLLAHVPFVIKEGITEKSYYRLHMMERLWPGLHAEIVPERFYPQGKIASTLIGYMGAISQNEYFEIACEIGRLQKFLEAEKNNENPSLPEGFSSKEEAERRLTELKEKAYCLNDLVGKIGIEKTFEKELRGLYGKRSFIVDIKGNFLKEKERRSKKSGKRLDLTISAKLQEEAEKLLAGDEKQRDGKSRYWDAKESQSLERKQPWIKGGAIVAMDPTSGEILALASYPRFDPNDFISSGDPLLKQKRESCIDQWLENKNIAGAIWEGRAPLARELYHPKRGFYEEKRELTFELFLNAILNPKSPIKTALEKVHNIKNAISIQEDCEELLYYSRQKDYRLLFDLIFDEGSGQKSYSLSEKEKARSSLLQSQDEMHRAQQNVANFLGSLPSNKERLFLVDLLRLMIFSPAFSDELIAKAGNMPLSDYWAFSRAAFFLEKEIANTLKPLFHAMSFKEWRRANEEDFLKAKREEEKQKELYPRPYADILYEKEKELFKAFFERCRVPLVLSLFDNDVALTIDEEDFSGYFSAVALLKKREKDREKQKSSIETLKKGLKHLPLDLGFAFLKTVRRFDKLDRPLLGFYPRLQHKRGPLLERDLASSFYPKNGYGYCRSYAFRQATPLGSLFKIATSYAALKQRFEKGLYPLNPLTLTDCYYYDPQMAKNGGMIVAIGLDKKPFPRFYKGGRLPKSSHADIGKVDLISALEQSSNPYFAILAGDYLDHPQDLLDAAGNFGFGQKSGLEIAGETAGFLPKDVEYDKTGLYSLAIGQHSLVVTPVQAAIMLCAIANKGDVLKPSILKGEKAKINQKLPLPSPIRSMILKGLEKVVLGDKGSARAEIISRLKFDSALRQTYYDLAPFFVGKSGTAEIAFNPDIDPQSRPEIYKHIWFGAISFEEKYDKPELVVVVYLQFGSSGKEAAPLAARMIEKYRQIKQSQSQ